MVILFLTHLLTCAYIVWNSNITYEFLSGSKSISLECGGKRPKTSPDIKPYKISGHPLPLAILPHMT
jgi:hypothetical protein